MKTIEEIKSDEIIKYNKKNNKKCAYGIPYGGAFCYSCTYGEINIGDCEMRCTYDKWKKEEMVKINNKINLFLKGNF